MWLNIEDNQAAVTVNVNNVVPTEPHAQHIHIGGQGACPTPDADKNGDGIISVPEGKPSYGDVQVALTKDGDSAADSALAVDRMPTGGEGSYTYERTLDVSDQVVQDLANGKASVVVHGIDPNGDGKYSGDAKSELDPELPLEATAPAACGELVAAPQGGMETGEGGVADEAASGALVAAGGVLAAAAAVGAFAIRRQRSNV